MYLLEGNSNCKSKIKQKRGVYLRDSCHLTHLGFREVNNSLFLIKKIYRDGPHDHQDHRLGHGVKAEVILSAPCVCT